MAIVPTSPEVANLYIGLSGDTKPPIATPGSTFYETDTKNSFITDGVGTWYALPSAGGGGGAATVADGADVAEGTTTDAAASSTVAENATARTGISLWKGIKNILILINAGVTSLLTGIVLAAGTNAIGKLAANAGVNIGVVGGTSIEVSDEFPRPADTTAYAAGDSIAAATTDSGTTPLRSIVVGAANGATGYLTKFRLDTDQAACVAVLEVHFYTVAAPPSAVTGDNVPFTLLYPNRAKRIGSMVFPALATTTPAGSSSMAKTADMTTRMAFQCDPADNKIYYRILTQTVFTPANAQNFAFFVTSERNAA